ncbi:DNA repair-scaffolding protein isoform X1 [Dipodomys spectabilis]|uniref:DNA repair-scaffolding protein isoform X1 n=1 Tax=Dipodomys spectabilis TaxID=105255 RepID=UPI001C53ED0E|nr:DNA repair-scaffolding protein isoform X1 [Dipodomys spectabilis]
MSVSDGARRPKQRKRKWDIEYPSFPEESPPQVRRASLRTVDTASTSLSEAWLKCGEGFQDISETMPIVAKATITKKDIELSPRPKKETTTSSTIEVTNITWSSSGSDLSDEDRTPFKLQKNSGNGSGIGRKTLCPEDGDSEDELQFIDWEMDSDREEASEGNECDDGGNTVEISDCASCASSHSLASDDRKLELKATSTEILEYSSDSDKEDDPENVLVINSESPYKYHVDFGSNVRQATDGFRGSSVTSTEPILCTPQKQIAKSPKTPESSAKNKKLIRGGLAERLSGLQNRERSAISLWRIQYGSYQKTLSGGQSGVLIVKILELHEECTMQVAMCEHLVGPPATSPTHSGTPRPGACLKVLFTREMAGHLRGHPKDIIHIFPPWQKLIIPNGSFPIILNAHFCQKMVAEEDAKTTHEMYTPLPRRSITLAQIFQIKDLTNNSPKNQVVCSDLATSRIDWSHRHEETEQHLAADTPLRSSLLDMLGSLGAAPWNTVGVRVIVQRVYSLPGRDGTKIQQRSLPENTDPPGARLCLLVQDAYRMFGEVHMEGAVSKIRELEGKPCSLTGVKVLQKATRVRTPGLFSLIDTLWPSMMPLKTPSQDQPCEEVKTNLPPPAFCYILSALPSVGQIDIIEDNSLLKLYQPPVLHYLKEILQMPDVVARCSFYARVIYQRPQLKSLLLLEQREIWLLVTDVTLQTKDESEPHLPKTLPVCVTSSCVLGPEVLEALTMAVPHTILFRDALREQGQIICVERTILLPQKLFVCVASGVGPCELPGPVMLDELNSFTPVNCICRVQGAVVGIDESTAFSWPVCDQCGNGRLEQRPEDGGTFSCGDCLKMVTSPVLKRHLQVFLECPSRPQCSVKVKLLQSSISSLLRFAACEDGSYEVKNILGKEVELSCFVQSVTTHPTHCIRLEEVELLGSGAPTDRRSPLEL